MWALSSLSHIFSSFLYPYTASLSSSCPHHCQPSCLVYDHSRLCHLSPQLLYCPYSSTPMPPCHYLPTIASLLHFALLLAPPCYLLAYLHCRTTAHAYVLSPLCHYMPQSHPMLAATINHHAHDLVSHALSMVHCKTLTPLLPCSFGLTIDLPSVHRDGTHVLASC